MVKFLKKRWYLFLIVFLISGLIVFNKINTDNQKKEAKNYIVKKENLKESLSLSGEIDAEEKITLRFQTSGRLTWVGVKEGDYVKKYQGIASLDQRQTKKTLEKYLYDYSKERNDFEEAKQTTYPSGAVTDTIKRILEKNQYDLNKAVLDVELQNIALEYSYLYTPIEGIVTKVGAPFAGVNITPAQAEFDIINPNTIYLSVTIDQTEVTSLKKGMIGNIVFDAYPDENIKGEVGNIDYIPKEGETGTVYEVKVKFNNIHDFRLGMTGDIDFVTKQRDNVLSVPLIYIKKDKKGNYVTVKENGIFTKRHIVTNGEIDGKIEIVSGLTDGEKIYD